MTIDRYRTPLLTARDTARHLRMPESTLDAWLSSTSGEPLVHAVAPERRGWPRVPFVGIVEAHVLRALRSAGVPMGDVRRAAAIVRAEFGSPFALAERRIATDGVAVLVRLADESLIRAHDDQHAMKGVLDTHLRDIDWDDSGTAIRLRLPHYPAGAEVVLDPRFGWGGPVLAAGKVRVDDVVGLRRTGESTSAVAEEYGLKETVVEDVLRHAA